MEDQIKLPKQTTNNNIILISVQNTSGVIPLAVEPVAISSPNYPENYSNNVDFSVFVYVLGFANVELHFLDFALDPSCSDSLDIDGGKSYYTA